MSYIREIPMGDDTFAPFVAARQTFGFIPNFFRAQTLRPDLIEAELPFIGGILVKEGALPRQLKEYVFLVCSAANLSTYCVTAHCEIVKGLGIHGPEPEQIALDYASTNLPMRTKALLAFALKLNAEANRTGAADIDALRTFGYEDQQILEAVLVVGVARFANLVAFGLGTLPDFESIRIKFDTAAG